MIVQPKIVVQVNVTMRVSYYSCAVLKTVSAATYLQGGKRPPRVGGQNFAFASSTDMPCKTS